MNSYSYSRNNPLRYVDPNGESIESTIQEVINSIQSVISSISSFINSLTGSSASNSSPPSGNVFLGPSTNTVQGPVESPTTWDPVTDQRIQRLDPRVQQLATNFINRTESQLGVQLRVTTGYRSIEEQNMLYEQGRSTSGNIVTNAVGGQSYHNYGLAIDVVRMNSGQPDWSNPITPDIADVGKRQGFEWGGDWANPHDPPHFQMTFGQTWQQLQGLR